MMSLVKRDTVKVLAKPSVLGIDVMCGTPLLELKNKFRSMGVFDVILSAFSEDAKYWLDLQTICEGVVKVDRTEYLLEHYSTGQFDYLLLGKPLNSYRNPYKLVEDMLSLIKNQGDLLLKVKNNYDVNGFLTSLSLGNADQEIVSHVDINNLNQVLNQKGYVIKDYTAEVYQMDDTNKSKLKQALKNSNLVSNIEESFQRLMIKEYVLRVGKDL